MHNFYRFLMAAMLTALFSVSAVHGEEPPMPGSTNLPSNYPATFQARGIVNHVGIRTLTISGTRYTVSISAIVHSPTSEHASRLDLREGVEIGFSYNRDPNNSRTIKEIWILPQGTIEPS